MHRPSSASKHAPEGLFLTGSRLYLICCLFASVAAAQNQTPFDQLPAVESSLFTGTVTHRVPIDLPPGPTGTAPQIAIVANHQVVDGLLGSGWTLEGLSRIDRRSKTYGVPSSGLAGAIFDDTYWLDGDQLIKSNGEYRLKHDDNRVAAAQGSGALPTYWEVRRDGWLWAYGQHEAGGETVGRFATETFRDSWVDGCTAQSRDRHFPTGWLLARAVDPAGNEIRYEYTSVCEIFTSPGSPAAGPFDAPAGGVIDHLYPFFDGEFALERLLSRITYANGFVRIQFQYGARPDIRASAASGRLRVQTHRLTAIEVIVDPDGAAERYSRYEISYADENEATECGTLTTEELRQLSGISLVRQIKRVGTDGSEKVLRCVQVNSDDTSIEYVRDVDLGTDGFGATNATVIPLVTNFDGDPYPDLTVISIRRQAELFPVDLLHAEVYRNTGADWLTPGGASLVQDTDPNGLAELLISVLGSSSVIGTDPAQPAGAYQIFDIDGDGATELVVVEQGDVNRLFEYDLATGSYVEQSGFTNLTVDDLRFSHPVDVNGDGLPDLVIDPHDGVTNTNWIPNAGSAPYLDSASVFDLTTPVEDPAHDAYAELVETWATCGTFLQYPPETTIAFHGSPPSPYNAATGYAFEHENEYMASQARWGDFNGDGVADIAYAFYACWESSTSSEPDCAQGVSDDQSGYWPCRDSILSRIYYGDGRGNFHDSALLAGTPFMRARGYDGYLPDPTGWCLDAQLDYWNSFGNSKATWNAYDAWTVVDLDRSGRPTLVHGHYGEMGDGTSQLKASAYQGLATGFGIAEEFAFGSGTDHDEGTWLNCNEREFGLPGYALSDLWVPPHYQLLADWDADGFTDMLTVYGRADVPDGRRDDCSDNVPATDSYAQFHRNSRTVARGRVESVRTAWGGVEAIDYTFSTASATRMGCSGDNDRLPYVVEVVNSIIDENGLREFALLNGEHDPVERRFSGFADAFVRYQNGRTSHLQFWTSDALFGQVRTRAEYAAEGLLEFFSLFKYGPGTIPADSTAPYFNPLRVRCDFWIGDPVDPNTLISDCCNFTQGGGGGGGDRPPPAIKSETPRKGRGSKQAARSACGSYRAYNCPAPGGPPQFLPLATPLPAAVVEPAPPSWPDPPAGAYRMYAQRWNFDTDQRLELHRDYRQVDDPNDDTDTFYSYDGYNPIVAGKQLTDIEEFGPSGQPLRHRERGPGFAFFNMPIRVAENIVNGNPCNIGSREWLYSYHSNGELLETTDAELNVTTFNDRNACGQLLMKTDAAMRVETMTYEACRLATRSFEGGSTTITRDGLGRVLTKTIDYGSGTQPMSESWTRDDTITGVDFSNAHARVTYADGTQVATHLDEWGREVLSVTTGDLDGDGSADAPVHQYRGYAIDGTLRFRSRLAFELTDTVGRGMFYDEFGRLVAESSPAHVPRTDPISYVTTSTAYEPGRTTVVDPIGVVTQNDFTTRAQTVTRGGIVQSTTKYDVLGNVVREVDADGVGYRTTYDGFYRPCDRRLVGTVQLHDGTITQPYEIFHWDDNDRRERRIDGEGNETRWTYDGLGRPLTEVFEGSDPTFDPVPLNLKTWTHESVSVDGQRRTTVKDINSNETTQTFDGGGRLLRTDYPDGSFAEQTWDNRGRGASSIAVDGTTRSYVYDAFGRRVAEIGPDPNWIQTWSYDVTGDLIGQADRDGVTDVHTNCWSGKRAQTDRGSWTLASWSYNADGTIETAYENGVTTGYLYDGLGRRTEACVGQTTPGDCAVRQTWTWTDGNRTQFTTRERGGTILTTEALYNAAGWPIEVVNPDLTSSMIGYDILGRVRKETDEIGVESEYRYDGLGRLRETDLPYFRNLRTVSFDYGLTHPIDPNLGSVQRLITTEPDGGVWETFTDFAGRVVAQTQPDNTVTWNEYRDGLLRSSQEGTSTPTQVLARTAYNYDSNARVFSRWGPVDELEYQAAGGSPGLDDYVFLYTWTPAGRQLSMEGPNDRLRYEWVDGFRDREIIDGVTTYDITYESGYPRVSSIQTGTSAPYRAKTLQWHRGLWLSQEQVVDGADTTVATFDDWDPYGTPRLVSNTLNGASQTDYIYGTDPLGRIDRIDATITGTPMNVDLQYHTNGQLETMFVTWPTLGHTETLDYSYTGADHELRYIRNGSGSVTYFDTPPAQRDDLGRPKLIDLANNGRVEYTYDQLGRTTQQITRRSPGGAFRTRDYVYDGRGRLEHMTISGGGGARLDRYVYAEPGWLTRETRREGAPDEVVIDYEYDAAGNRTRRELPLPGGGTSVTTSTYAYGNRLATVDGTTVSWDDYGGITTDHRGFTIEREPTGRAAEVRDSGAVLFYSITRDAGRRPTAITGPAGTRHQIWGNPGGDWPLAGLDEAGEAVLWVAGEGRLLARVEVTAGGSVTVHQTAVDTRGSLEMYDTTFLSEAGAWGDSAVPSAPGGAELRTYAQLDNLPGPFMMARHRLYDPQLGRFMAKDPIGFLGGDNLFSYAGSDPVNASDPSGLFRVSLTGASASVRDPGTSCSTFACELGRALGPVYAKETKKKSENDDEEVVHVTGVNDQEPGAGYTETQVIDGQTVVFHYDGGATSEGSGPSDSSNEGRGPGGGVSDESGAGGGASDESGPGGPMSRDPAWLGDPDSCWICYDTPSSSGPPAATEGESPSPVGSVSRVFPETRPVGATGQSGGREVIAEGLNGDGTKTLLFSNGDRVRVPVPGLREERPVVITSYSKPQIINFGRPGAFAELKLAGFFKVGCSTNSGCKYTAFTEGDLKVALDSNGKLTGSYSVEIPVGGAGFVSGQGVIDMNGNVKLVAKGGVKAGPAKAGLELPATLDTIALNEAIQTQLAAARSELGVTILDAAGLGELRDALD